mgnify:CR=1 FL=1|jgi:hypothetical protein|tara:strand:+ start:557 stop:763 length:207 start_codon:yes stop_codon:yes gene_type:complete
MTNNKFISIDDDKYRVIAVVPMNSKFSPDKLKSMWRLADTIVSGNNEYYICSKLIQKDLTEEKTKTEN